MNEAPRTRRPTLSRGDLDTTPLLGASVVEFQRMVQFDILRGLTVTKCVRWMEEARMGFLCHPLRAWEALAIRDDVIPTVKWKREDAVAQRPWSLLQSADVKTDKSLQKEADDQKRLLGYFWNNIRVVDAWDRNQRGLFSAFVRMALHIQSMRYGAIHFVWRPGAKGLTATLEFVPGWMFENFSGVLRYIGPDPSIMYGTPIEDDPNWLIIGGKGLMEPGSLGATIKAGGLDTWIKYCRRYGLPFPLGKTNASPGDKQWKEMERAVRGINNDNGAVIGTGATIELLKAEGTGDTPSSLLVERIDRAFSSMWRGGDLGTMSSKSGQGTGSDQQSGESDLIEAADCTWLSEIMQEIDRRVLAYFEGEDVEVLSYSNVRGPNLVDAKAELGVDEFAIQNGFKLSKKEWGERNNRSEAADDDDVLTPVTGVTPAKVPSVEEQLDTALNYNPWHDSRGLFTTAEGGSVGGGGAKGRPPHVLAEMHEVRQRTQGTPGWMKAPNGDPTHLNEEDWLHARTPSYKAANGDWEALAHQKRFDDMVKLSRDEPAKGHSMYWRPFDAEEASAVKRLTGVDAAGFQHEISTDQIRHITKSHPELTADDIGHIPVVLDSWDHMEKGNPKSGHESVRFVKQMPGRKMFVVERLMATSREKLPRGTVYTAWKESGPSTRPASSGNQRQSVTRSAGMAREEHALTYGRVNPADIKGPLHASGEPLHIRPLATNEASPVPAQFIDAVHEDMRPFCNELAKLLPDPSQAAAIDWKAVARSVLDGGGSTAVLLGELAKAGLGGFGISEAQINDILSKV